MEGDTILQFNDPVEEPEKNANSLLPEENLLDALHHFVQENENYTVLNSGTVVDHSSSIKENAFFPSLQEPVLEKTQEERYEILQTLGEGGMGVVQLVKDRLLGREVALKKIKAPRSTSKNLSEQQKKMLWRFHKEVEITAILEHPNIVPLYEMQHQKEGELCFTMRKVEGRTFRKILKAKQERQEDWDENKLLGIYLKVCDAMAYAHNRGIVHRDLKPDNIMVGSFGEVYVMDWGIAKKLNEKEMLENIELSKTRIGIEENTEKYKTLGGMGTVGYMAPEQAENASEVTPQSDIYSLGMILRECFTLFSPKEELQRRIKLKLTQQEKANQRKKKAFNDEETLEKNIPKEIVAIIEKARKINPQERYESVQKLSQDLESYQKNLRVSAKAYTSLELVFKWIQRHQQQLRLASIILFVLVGILFGYSEWKKSKEIQNHLTAAKQREEQAKKILPYDNRKKFEKIGNLLYAVNFLNSVLMVKPNSTEAQESKLRIGEELVQVCCETTDYNLATFVANDLEMLSIVGKKKYAQLSQKIKDAQGRMLKQHQERLNEFVYRFKNFEKNSFEKGELENASIEISKMKEEEIWTQMMNIVQEGNKYFLEEETRKSPLENFYTVMMNTLGYMENSKSKDLLLETLKKLAEKEAAKEKGTSSVSRNEYMIAIVEALYHLKVLDFAPTLNQIRWKMGQNSTFSKRTVLIYQKLDNEGILSPFNEAIRLNPQSAKAYIDRGHIKRDKGDTAGAIADFIEATHLKPQYSEAFNNRGNAKAKIGDKAGAIADYNEVIRLNPHFAEVYHHRGNAKYETEDLAGALADYTEAIRLNPQDALSFHNRGNIKYEKGELEEALNDQTEAIRLNPRYALTYIVRGFTKEAKGDKDGAIEDYEKALSLIKDSDIEKKLIDLLKNKFKQTYSTKDYESAKATLLRLKPYLSQKEQTNIDKKLEEIEKLMQQKK